jgi:hypothetical protein
VEKDMELDLETQTPVVALAAIASMVHHVQYLYPFPYHDQTLP